MEIASPFNHLESNNLNGFGGRKGGGSEQNAGGNGGGWWWCWWCNIWR